MFDNKTSRPYYFVGVRDGLPQIEWRAQEWTETTDQHPTRYQKFYRYFQFKEGNSTFYNRVNKTDTPEDDIKKEIEAPCYHKDGFKGGYCIECGAIEGVVNNWARDGKLYLGHGNIIKNE